MKRLGAVLAMLGMTAFGGALFLGVPETQAAWKGDWTYQPGDLSGASNLQDAVDNLDGRMDAVGVTSTSATGNVVLNLGYGADVGSSATQVWYTAMGTNACGGTENVTNTFAVTFLAKPYFTYNHLEFAAKVPTNLVTLTTSNVVITLPQTTLTWIVRGRIR
jgi:hypothetical protein